MKAVERQRKKLYAALEQGLSEKILNESQKLDKLIMIEQKKLLKKGTGGR